MIANFIEAALAFAACAWWWAWHLTFVAAMFALVIAALVLIFGPAAKEDVERHVQRALDEESHDWVGEPTTCVEYGPPTEAETPIYSATAAHIAKHSAADIDGEWAELNRRGA